MIRCLGFNENKMDHFQFQRLFHIECMKVGKIRNIMFMNNQIGAAYVDESN